MTTTLVRVLQYSGYLPDADFVTLCLATNRERNYLLIEALAGTGKTTLTLDVIRRLDCRKCIVLSFTKTAVKVARVRLLRTTGEWLQTQTLDSLFHHMFRSSGTHDFQQYRDMVVEATCEDLEVFKCRTRNLNYEFRGIEYVFVDEAQDSPPETINFLRLCRSSGKHVIIAGDRHQSIFKFMKTSNLFDTVPKCHSVCHRLTRTHRCVQSICDYVNSRFGLDMVSTRDPQSYDNTCTSASLQCRNNRSLAQLYATLLSSVRVQLILNVPETDTDLLYQYTRAEISKKYGLLEQESAEALETMQYRSAKSRGPVVVLSTVHRYKGDESDITILGYDLDVTERSAEEEEENVKYVACTRARYGLLHTSVPMYVGVLEPLRLLGNALGRYCYNSGLVSVSQFVNSPVTLVRLMGSPLREYLELTAQAYNERETTWSSGQQPRTHPRSCQDSYCTTLVGSACDVALSWFLEYKAYQSSVLNTFLHYPELHVSVSDDRKLKTTIKQGIVTEEEVYHFKRAITRGKLCCLLSRYLVVRHGYPLQHQFVMSGALQCAILQCFSYSKSVVCLTRRVTTCCKLDYRNTVTSVVERLPPLLSNSSNWKAINIHGVLVEGQINLRGSFDIMILDKSDCRHIIELKCVRHLKFSHFWQCAMYTVMCALNQGVPVHKTMVWSLRDNVLYTLPSDKVISSVEVISRDTHMFNALVSCKHSYEYYRKQYTREQLCCK